jgi:hypothetical protein
MDSENLTRTTHCKTAAEFISALSPRGEHFGTGFFAEWIFRGHLDDRFQLVPAALRNQSNALAEIASVPITNNKTQQGAEKYVLGQFFELSDRIGLALPEDTQKLRLILEARIASLDQASEEWPPHEILSLMALAQHSGLPTRLLDWSRNPLKAALFAAGAADEGKEGAEFLSVWAFHLGKFRLVDADMLPFTVVTAPSASNSNLRAQEGLFTLAKGIKADEGAIDRSPFDEILAKWAETNKVSSSGSWFHRITLPRSEAESLSFELSIDGIKQTSLHPNFYGVVKAMREELRWSEQGGPASKRLEELDSELPFISLMKTASLPEIAHLLPRRDFVPPQSTSVGSTFARAGFAPIISMAATWNSSSG